MAKHFRYYDDWKSKKFTCPDCGWKGTFDEGCVEIHSELMDSSCPICDYYSTPMLAIVSWPTMEESEENWDKVSDIDKHGILLRKDFLEKLENMRLKSADELPDLEGSSINITWDIVGEEPNGYTVLIHEGKEIWREPAVYEGYIRFGEIVDILKEKYAECLIGVEPTKRSELYLYGDSFGAIKAVERARNRIQEKDD